MANAYRYSGCEEKRQMGDIWEQIGRSVGIIWNALRLYRIRLNPDQGLGRAIDEARQLSLGTKLSTPATEVELFRLRTMRISFSR
jgi:hypothetical protein